MDTQTPPAAYTPNHIPVWTRVFYGFASPGLILYGAIGLLSDDPYIPGKRGPGTRLHGPAAWPMAAAMLMAALNLGSVVVDHFDERNNETDYRRFANVTSWAGYGFFGMSLLWFVIQGIRSGTV